MAILLTNMLVKILLTYPTQGHPYKARKILITMCVKAMLIGTILLTNPRQLSQLRLLTVWILSYCLFGLKIWLGIVIYLNTQAPYNCYRCTYQMHEDPISFGGSIFVLDCNTKDAYLKCRWILFHLGARQWRQTQGALAF